MKSLSNSLFFVAVALLLSVSGCGGNKFPVKPAKGKVVAQGKPVTAGSVTFTPAGTAGEIETGKPASAAIGPDGTFVLSTFSRFDGAIVGKHSVQYTGPEDEDGEEAEEAEGSSEEPARPAKRPAQPKPQYVQKEPITVEVTASGPNDFTIELSPAGR